MHMALTERHYFARGFAIALQLFAVIPLLYAGCPQGMCCPFGINCKANTALCKPSSSEDCREGIANVLIYFQ